MLDQAQIGDFKDRAASDARAVRLVCGEDTRSNLK